MEDHLENNFQMVSTAFVSVTISHYLKIKTPYDNGILKVAEMPIGGCY